MTNKKTLSALCYFSVFFFPLLIPFVIYLLSDDKEVKIHAKRSFISHLIPIILLIIGVILFSISMFTVEKRMMAVLDQQFDFWQIAPFLFTLVYSLLFMTLLIWNVFQGVKVLK